MKRVIRSGGPSVDTLRLMTILAHPDDESLATGGSLAKYGSEGVDLPPELHEGLWGSQAF